MDDYNHDDEQVGQSYGYDSDDSRYAYAEGFDWTPSYDEEADIVQELFGD